MFKHLWVERGMLSGLTKKTCILVIVILSSTLAAGIVQDSLLEKVEKASVGHTVGHQPYIYIYIFISRG